MFELGQKCASENGVVSVDLYPLDILAPISEAQPFKLDSIYPARSEPLRFSRGELLYIEPRIYVGTVRTYTQQLNFNAADFDAEYREVVYRKLEDAGPCVAVLKLGEGGVKVAGVWRDRFGRLIARGLSLQSGSADQGTPDIQTVANRQWLMACQSPNTALDMVPYPVAQPPGTVVTTSWGLTGRPWGLTGRPWKYHGRRSTGIPPQQHQVLQPQ
jgi:hypothetical protein